MRDERYDLLKMFHVKHFKGSKGQRMFHVKHSGGVSELISCLSEKVLYIKAMEVFYLLENEKNSGKRIIKKMFHVKHFMD